MHIELYFDTPFSQCFSLLSLNVAVKHVLGCQDGSFERRSKHAINLEVHLLQCLAYSDAVSFAFLRETRVISPLLVELLTTEHFH